MNTVEVGNIKCGGNNKLFLIAGPCVIENEKLLFRIAERMVKITQKIGLPYIFKTSYDKANRLSIKSYRGPGLKKGVKILKRLKSEFGFPILCDVHKEEEVDLVAEVVDVIQIPAFLCRQTDLTIKVAKSKKVVNVKKGQFLAPSDIKYIIEKIESSGNKKILITERGTSFGYNNLVSDMRSIPLMRSFGYPVVFDATHSVQQPGGLGGATGGDREMAKYLARAAVACHADGLFLEVHENPDSAPSDAKNMLELSTLPAFLELVLEISNIVRRNQEVLLSKE